MSDAALALELRRLALLVGELVDDQQHAQRRLLDGDDRRIGTVLLPLAADLAGAAPVTGPRLYALALNDRTSTGQALREVLAEYGSPRQLGKLLARLDGVPLAGVRLLPAGERREGRAWRFVRVSDD